MCRDLGAELHEIQQVSVPGSVACQDLVERGLPGALIGLRRGAGEAEALALGVADVEAGAPMTTEMTMRLGSLAKLCVGTVALQLVDEGRIGLDDAVSAYRPDVPGGACPDRLVNPACLLGHAGAAVGGR